MQYRFLIDLLDGLINSKSRVESAKRNRPESSSPEKLKMRNPQIVTGSSKGAKEKAPAEASAQEDDDDQYTEEDEPEIANDLDEEEDGIAWQKSNELHRNEEGTKGLFNLAQLQNKSSSSLDEKPEQSSIAGETQVDPKKAKEAQERQ